VLRPHVHREALAAPVTQLDDFPCFWVHVLRSILSLRFDPVCRSILAVTVVAGALLFDLTVVASDDLHKVGARAPVFSERAVV
jgi:hypothetical protein